MRRTSRDMTDAGPARVRRIAFAATLVRRMVVDWSREDIEILIEVLREQLPKWTAATRREATK